jgi:hypothetical protein
MVPVASIGPFDDSHSLLLCNSNEEFGGKQVDSLLSCNILSETLDYQLLGHEFHMHAFSEEALQNSSSVVHNERKDSFLVEVPGEERIKAVIDRKLAHIY